MPDLLDGLPARADLLLHAAAQRHGDRPALVLGSRKVTYAELDAAVDRCAAVLRERFGAGGAVVAIGADLHPDVVIAYHGALRSGNQALMVIPLLREQQLQYVLEASGARAALVGAALHERLSRVRHGLPGLELVALLGEEPGDADPGRPPSLAQLLEAAVPGAPEWHADPGAPAALHFTSGTTGLPKAVVLSHLNVTVNAVQTARAHGLEAGSVTLVHFPSYHPMHMNSALAAGATQVLVPEADPAHAMERARTCGAGYIYSLPARLAQLAAHPRLAGMRLPDAVMIASGGSALAPALAGTLSRHFGVPVVQGYGLAEASPLTHFDRPGEHLPGSVGRPVEGTEHRAVSLEDGSVLPPGEHGEIQVRGPQVMRGYLDPAHGPAVDADGWLATGDVGRIDGDGQAASHRPHQGRLQVRQLARRAERDRGAAGRGPHGGRQRRPRQAGPGVRRGRPRAPGPRRPGLPGGGGRGSPCGSTPACPTTSRSAATTSSRGFPAPPTARSRGANCGRPSTHDSTEVPRW